MTSKRLLVTMEDLEVELPKKQSEIGMKTCDVEDRIAELNEAAFGLGLV